MALTVLTADIGKVWTFTVNREDGTRFDLTGASSVQLLISGQAARTCVVTDAAGGVATYTTVADDFPSAGALTGVLRIVNPSGTFHTREIAVAVGTLP